MVCATVGKGGINMVELMVIVDDYGDDNRVGYKIGNLTLCLTEISLCYSPDKFN